MSIKLVKQSKRDRPLSCILENPKTSKRAKISDHNYLEDFS